MEEDDQEEEEDDDDDHDPDEDQDDEDMDAYEEDEERLLAPKKATTATLPVESVSATRYIKFNKTKLSILLLLTSNLIY